MRGAPRLRKALPKRPPARAAVAPDRRAARRSHGAGRMRRRSTRAASAKIPRVPQECLILTMKQHQKYFPLLDAASGKLLAALPRRIESADRRPARTSSTATSACCARGCRTRSSSTTRTGKSGWKRACRSSRTWSITTGSAHSCERVERVQRLAGRYRARARHRLRKLAERAAWLCKADLVTGMVGEFPELQGIMGRYYACTTASRRRVADAIEAALSARASPATRCRNRTRRCAVALADKLETLAGLFGIGQEPTRRQGSVRLAPRRRWA